MNKVVKTFAFLITTYLFLFLPKSVIAMCPVCTVAVGAGLGISRVLGIDDMVTSIWIGGLIISVSLWTFDFLKRKQFKILNKLNSGVLTFLLISFWSLLTLLPLHFSGLIGRSGNSLWGIDKIIFGTIVGFFVFLISVYLDKLVRKIRGKQFFNYQKVIFPVTLLLIASFVMYLLTK